jgi:hypothetical protein
MSNEITISVPPVEVLGPAMRALNERQRSFVCALAVYGGEQGEAYRAAGYQVTERWSARACASRLANSADRRGDQGGSPSAPRQRVDVGRQHAGGTGEL